MSSLAQLQVQDTEEQRQSLNDTNFLHKRKWQQPSENLEINMTAIAMALLTPPLAMILHHCVKYYCITLSDT